MGHVSKRISMRACDVLFENFTPQDYLNNLYNLLDDPEFEKFKEELSIVQFQSFLDYILQEQEAASEAIETFSGYYEKNSSGEYDEFNPEPKYEDTVFTDKVVLFTGDFNQVADRETYKKWIWLAGGRSQPRLVKSIDYVIVGENPGPSKMIKIKNWEIPTMTEAEFVKLFPEEHY